MKLLPSLTGCCYLRFIPFYDYERAYAELGCWPLFSRLQNFVAEQLLSEEHGERYNAYLDERYVDLDVNHPVLMHVFCGSYSAKEMILLTELETDMLVGGLLPPPLEIFLALILFGSTSLPAYFFPNVPLLILYVVCIVHTINQGIFPSLLLLWGSATIPPLLHHHSLSVLSVRYQPVLLSWSLLQVYFFSLSVVHSAQSFATLVRSSPPSPTLSAVSDRDYILDENCSNCGRIFSSANHQRHHLCDPVTENTRNLALQGDISTKAFLAELMVKYRIPSSRQTILISFLQSEVAQLALARFLGYTWPQILSGNPISRHKAATFFEASLITDSLLRQQYFYYLDLEVACYENKDATQIPTHVVWFISDQLLEIESNWRLPFQNQM